MEARNVQLPVLRRLTPPERVAVACELSEELVSLTADGMRHRHPELSGKQIADAVRRVLLGAELTERLRVGRAGRP